MITSAPCLSLSKPHRIVQSKLQNLAQCLCGFREDKYQQTSLPYPFSTSHRKPYTQKVIQKPQRQSCLGRWLAGDLLQKVDSSHRTSHLEGHTDLTSSNRCLALASTAFSACAFSPCTHIQPLAAFSQHRSPLSLDFLVPTTETTSLRVTAAQSKCEYAQHDWAPGVFPPNFFLYIFLL